MTACANSSSDGVVICNGDSNRIEMSPRTYNTVIPALAIRDDDLHQVDLSISYLLHYFGHSQHLPSVQEAISLPLETDINYEEASRTAFLELTLFLGPQCNARCTLCYTSRVRREARPSRLLTLQQLQECIDLAARYGAKVVYIPGLGEPLLDPRFFALLESGSPTGLQFVIATNGIAMADEVTATQAWGCTCSELIERCLRLPVTFLHKVWGTTRHTLCVSLGTTNYPTQRVGEVDVPLSIIKLLAQGFPVARLAVQAVATPDNIQEIRKIRNYYGDVLGLGLILEETLRVGGGCNGAWPRQGTQSELDDYVIRDCFRHRIRLTIDHEGNILNCPASIEQPLFNLFEKMGGSIADKDVLPILFKDTRWVANKRRCAFAACPQCASER
jgi:hypothetical protein